ncbi:hypothetical protein GCM10010840_21380 [Deinococcus aerolatus]|uniref:Uncharacterized protein n=1 Tax=Deinococcus aerolatus TaxID=522487 RepID=A0ABQ2GA91_9DEIO|nr:hypothetical protein [Deinococcus aerolatus]GGL83349.1 hypothetical protein GCM10010840_21380 [Deinococcus aerolatus]
MTAAPREDPWLDAPSRVSWRAYGLALLPLAAAGWLPWWATALLCALFAVAVRWPRWEEGRLLLSLLIVGGAALALAPAALALGRGALVGPGAALPGAVLCGTGPELGREPHQRRAQG